MRTMILQDIFTRPVDRPIEGVIKADDDAALRTEVDEYVLTKEIAKRLEEFLDAYNNYEGANGAWISGFFGSGKSHLLKLLALLLENRKIDNVPVIDLFLPKCLDNEILRGDLKRAVQIPSKSILFNIDQKADVISKKQTDALLAVFVKVFDETCGYYGKQGHIAQFERDLDARELYERFKTAYKDVSKLDWQVGREQALLESENISRAYAIATGSETQNTAGILDKYRNEYKVSIEDFATQVNDYIQRQGTSFRLNFFVDEVGQYIADNIKLMTNLQTIAESLATKSRGRAWIIVTAQEDMTTVVGEMTKQQGHDFSKIQARFATRMKLTSADVAEVIQKRLLEKTEEEGVEILSKLYHEQVNNFKTLFDFADGSQTYRNFQDKENFIHSYPFIPYQFTLFQSSIQNLSLHNAFEGKHSSVGERSMLGVFQQVSVRLASQPIGQLATFDLMFEGIRNALKSQIQAGIQRAEKHLDNKFAVRVLKALFLVKYVKEFKATVRNLCVLMHDRFDENMPELRKRIETSLNLLEQQTYIQRNGDEYEFLTDEEKDVEEEIKNTDVESTDVSDELAKIIFDNVIKDRKIRYTENGQDYPFSRRLDDKLKGREYELSVHVLTPFYENVENDSFIKTQTLNRSELVVAMPVDDRLVRDLLMYKRTEKYIRQNISIAQQDSIRRILTDKSSQNRDRYSELQKLVHNLLAKSKLFADGRELEFPTGEPQPRIVRAFSEVIVRSYPNLRMLRGFSYSENEVAKYLNKTQDASTESDTTALDEPEQEVLAFVHTNGRSGIRTTLKNLIERFERKPYGWSYPAVLCTVAKLIARGKIELRTDGNILEEDELEKALRNTHGQANVLLEPQIDFSQSQIRKLKQFYEDFFDSPSRANEAKALAKETVAALKELAGKLAPIASQSSDFPFVTVLDSVISRLNDLSMKDYAWFLTEFGAIHDELLGLKEASIDPIRKFMAGPQKDIFHSARSFLQAQEPNFSYINADEVSLVSSTLSDPDCYRGNRVQKIKTLVESLKSKVADHIQLELQAADQAISELRERLTSLPEFKDLTSERKNKITNTFDELSNRLCKQQLIAVIRDTVRRFEEAEYQRLLSQISEWTQENAEQQIQNKTSSAHSIASRHTAAAEPKIEYITGRQIKIEFDKPWISDESDVERYVQLLRTAWLAEIRKGKRIQI